MHLTIREALLDCGRDCARLLSLASLVWVLLSVGCSGGSHHESSGTGSQTAAGGASGQSLATTAVDDVITTDQDVPVDIDVLANDHDGASRGLSYLGFTQGRSGTVLANRDARLTLRYTPRLHFSGTDSFSYTVKDGAGAQATGIVRVTVRPVTLAVGDRSTILEDATTEILVLANDTDGGGGGLTVAAVTQPARGAATILGGRSVRYQPERNYFGDDRFEYTIEDSVGARSTGTVDLTIQPVNDAPTVTLDIEVTRVSRGGYFSIGVIADDPDSDATVDVFADLDGDLDTLDDQHVLASRLAERDGTREDVMARIDGIPLGSYSIFAEARDNDAPPVVERALDRIDFANVASVSGAGGPGFDAGQAVATWPDGGYIVAGRFSDVAVFGAGEARRATLRTAGGEDGFVARYLPSGEFDWAVSFGGVGDDRATGIAVFPDGSSVVVGQFVGTARFEGGRLTIDAVDGVDSFVVRLDPRGRLVWLQRLAGMDLSSHGDVLSDVASFADGSAVVVGSFEQDLGLRIDHPDQRFLRSVGRTDAFAAKYLADGSVAWAIRAGGPGEDHGFGVTTFPDGSFAIVGDFFAEAEFGSDGPVRRVLSADGVSDVFVAAYDARANLRWARRDGGIAAESARDVAGFSDGSLVITGELHGTAVFGLDGPRSISLTPVDGPDIFVARYDRDGALSWARRDGGRVSSQGDRGLGIAALRDGSCVVTGVFETDAVFGAGEARQTQLFTNSASDVFLARYNELGRLDWVRQGGGRDLGLDGDRGLAVATFADGAIAVTGFFDDEGAFGLGEPGGRLLRSGPAPDAFVVVYNADGGL